MPFGGTVIQQGGTPQTVGGPDGVTLIIQPPNTAGFPVFPTTKLAIGGTGQWGFANVPFQVAVGQDILNNVGLPQVSTYDLATDLDILVRSGANNLWAYRFTDSTDVAAIFKAPDNSGFASGTLTSGGAFSTSSTLSCTLTPVSGSAVTVSYPVQSSDVNIAGALASFTAAIQNSAAALGAAPFIKATTSSTVVTITALLQGTGGNGIGISCTVTGGTMTLTASGANLSGGAAPGTNATLTGRCTGSLANKATMRTDYGSAYSSTSPTYKFTIAWPNGINEVFDNIIAYATVGGGFSSTTYNANLANAINGSPVLSALRGASAYFSAVAGSSTVAPVVGVPFTYYSAGTDGSTFSGGTTQATAAAIGNSLVTPPTGLYSLASFITGGVGWIAGLTDVSGAGSAIQAFGQAQNANMLLSFPTGTSSPSAISTKQSLGLGSPNLFLLKDFAEFTDLVNQIVSRRVAPYAFVGSVCASTPVHISPANQPIQIITGTERTGAAQQQPYQSTEVDSLEINGINLITNPSNGGNFWGMAHNKNSLGKYDPRGNMAYSRLTAYIAQTLSAQGVIGYFIGKTQRTTPGDPLRRQAKGIIDNTFLAWKNGGVIQDFLTKCDLTNNPVIQIQRGQLEIDILCQYLSIIDRIVMVYMGGQTVTVNFQPTNLTSLPTAA